MNTDRLSRRISKTNRAPLLSQAIEEYLVACKSQGVSPATQSNYKWVLNLFKSWATKNSCETVADLTSSVIRCFIAERAEHGDKPYSLHTYFRIIRTFSLWMLREGVIEQNPVANVKAPKVPKELLEPLTVEQIETIDKFLSNTKNPYVVRNRALVFLLLDTGIRIEECSKLKCDTVDLVHGTFIVDGKGAKQRLVRLGATGLKYLNRYLQVRNGRPGAALWIGERGPMTKLGLMETIEKISIKAEVKFSAHTLRRTFAIFCLRNGMDTISLMKLMGHEDLSTTLRYLKMVTTDLVNAHTQFSPLDRMNTGDKLELPKPKKQKPDVLQRHIPTVKAS